MTLDQEIGRRFDARAAHYNNPVTSFIGERELRVIRRLVPEGATVLDYGCGTGRTALDHLRRGCALTAYDISIKMLAVAEAKTRALGLSAEFITDPACLRGRCWPLVTCIGVLDYYSDPVPVLKELGNYLQPGGRLIVTCPNAFSPLAWLYAAGSRFTIPSVAHSPGFMQQAAVQAGFKVFALYHAFPEFALIGHTLVIGLQQIGTDEPTLRGKIHDAAKLAD